MSEASETIIPQEQVDVKTQLQEQIDAWDSLGEDEKENYENQHDKLEADEAIENASSEAIAEHLRQHKLNKENPAYVVRGAELMCDQGTNKRQMNLSPCHGVYIRGHAVPHELDCIQGEEDNITMFGVCNSGEAPDAELIKLVDDNGRECHGKKCCPKIVGVWQDSFEGTRIVDTEKREENMEQLEGCSTITMDSFLVCKYGGIIIPINSGQDREVGEGEFCNPDEASEILGFVDKCAGESDIEGGCGDLLHEYHIKENGETRTVGIHGSDYFTVTFQYEDGEIIKQQEVRIGEDATAPTGIEKEGYVFDKWDIQYTNITEDITVTAVFKLDWINAVKKIESIEGYTKAQLATAKYVAIELHKNGYSTNFICAVLGNIYAEGGKAGYFENSAYRDSKIKPRYLKHMDNNHEYGKYVSNKGLYELEAGTGIFTSQLGWDIENKCFSCNNFEDHKFGFGMCQWTDPGEKNKPGRLPKLIMKYLDEIGEGVTPNEEDCHRIETEYLLMELQEQTYSMIAGIHKEECTLDKATSDFLEHFEHPKDWEKKITLRIGYAENVLKALNEVGIYE